MKTTLLSVAVSSTLLLSGCQSFRTGYEKTQVPYKPQVLNLEDLSEHEKLFKQQDNLLREKVKASIENQTPLFLSPLDIQQYVQSAMTLSDKACNVWLDIMGQEDVNTSHLKDIMNIVGNLLLGIAGINGSSPENLARGSLFLSAGNASIEAYKANILLGVIDEIRIKLEELRKISARNIELNISLITDYFSAQRIIMDYHGTCSRHSIADILKKSLQNSEYKSPDTSLSSIIGESKALAKSGEMHELIFEERGTIDNDTLYQLYLVYIVKEKKEEDLAGLAKTISEKVSGENNNDKKEKFIQLLASISSNLNFAGKLAATKAATVKAQKEVEIRKAQQLLSELEEAKKKTSCLSGSRCC